MNGRRAALALEECGLAYEVHRLDLAKGAQREPAFLAVNPHGTIPVVVDDDAPAPIVQSGAIVLYCATKSCRLVPQDAQRRADAFAWFMQAVTDTGPASSAMFQLTLAREQNEPIAIHFLRRFLAFCEQADARLRDREYLADEFSIADVALYPITLARAELIDRVSNLADLKAWMRRVGDRDATRRALAANG